MSQPFEPQPPTEPWFPPPVTEVSSEDWTAPTAPPASCAGPSSYAGPAPYGAVQYGPQAPYPVPFDTSYGAGWPPVMTAPPANKRRRLGWIIGAAAAVVLLGAGGISYAAYAKLNGGGPQPDSVTPAGAIAFVRVDLNPSASQKLAAARFLGKLPKTGNQFSAGGDWRQGLFDLISQDGDLPSGVDFNRDVKPWLGQRMAVAALPGADDNADPDTLLLLQSTDDSKAKAGIAHFDPKAGVDFYRGYAIVAESQALADKALAQTKQGSLAGSSPYRDDMAAVGTLGVASGWLDLTKSAGHESSFGSTSGLAQTLTGREAFTLRFSGSSADLVAKSFGRPASSTTGGAVAGAQLGRLPATTAAAVSMSVPKGVLDQEWSAMADGLTGAGGGADALQLLQDRFGLKLPDDLDTLLGSEATIAVDREGLADDNPSFGLLTIGNGSAGVQVLNRIRDAAGDLPFEYQATSSGLAVASNSDYLAQLTDPSQGRLADVPGFAAALPDLSGAIGAGFVNLDAVSDAMRSSGSASADDIALASVFSAIGFTVSADGTIHVRLTAH